MTTFEEGLRGKRVNFQHRRSTTRGEDRLIERLKSAVVRLLVLTGKKIVCFRRKYNTTPHDFSGYRIVDFSSEKKTVTQIVDFLNSETIIKDAIKNIQEIKSNEFSLVPVKVYWDINDQSAPNAGEVRVQLLEVWTLSEHFCLVTLL